MHGATATIGVMPKKKDSSDGKKPNRTPAVTIFARIKPRLGRALEDYINSVRPRTSTTAVLEAALEDFLSVQGFWPPKTPDAD